MGFSCPERGSYIIRPMRPEDTAQIACIERDVYSTPWSEASFCETLRYPYYRFLVAQPAGEPGTILGYCGFQQSFEEADITNVTVLLSHRRKGIARTMLGQLMDDGRERGVERFTLEVRASNEGAIRLYKSLGFYQEGLRRNFYDDPKEDALILWTGMKS